jgi:hypothetical protein
MFVQFLGVEKSRVEGSRSRPHVRVLSSGLTRGLGVTGVLLRGAVAAGLVLRRNLVPALAKPLPEA